MQHAKQLASAGIIGLVFLFFALVAYLIGARLPFSVNLVFGVLAIVLWATSSRETLGTLMGPRATRYGANALVYSVAFVALLIAVNYISRCSIAASTSPRSGFSASPPSRSRWSRI